MSSISYRIAAFDADTLEYIVTYPVAGTTKKILVPVVRSGTSVDATRTKRAIEVKIRELESPEEIPSIPDDVDDLIGYSGDAQITTGVV
jgi:hypothetical protein